jgi:hypothetical protein
MRWEEARRASISRLTAIRRRACAGCAISQPFNDRLRPPRRLALESLAARRVNFGAIASSAELKPSIVSICDT